MPRHTLSETDICDRFITPALRQAGWLKERILREHVVGGQPVAPWIIRRLPLARPPAAG